MITRSELDRFGGGGLVSLGGSVLRGGGVVAATETASTTGAATASETARATASLAAVTTAALLLLGLQGLKPVSSSSGLDLLIGDAKLLLDVVDAVVVQGIVVVAPS